MDIVSVKSLLLWCFILNAGIVLIWFLTALFWRWPYDLCCKWFSMSRERMLQINFLGIALYKAANLLFFLMPLVALSIVKPGT